ncbi:MULTISPECIES: YlxR family protein [Occultella]|uniref:YlxR family protein n=1 Tax=Occultella gossypii TaxID=2800820 RepID=A0ABS7S6G4_9MICO|nr:MULTISPECIES: YlxR family protein [Occultella]MBZ2195946.1 YlxR family protein [Occultella gossypii]
MTESIRRSQTAGPVRTCVGCRERGPRSGLVRLVADRTIAAHAVVVDVTTSAPGRGAWVHPHPDCLDRAVNRRAIGRALRLEAPAEVSRVEEWFVRNVRTTPSIIEQESGSEADGHPMSTQR